MVGTEVAAVFLKRRVQPAMARVHPMWLYSGPKDITRVNAAKLSEKELLDEVRHLTFFSQEDSIPLTCAYSPLDADHPPPELWRRPKLHPRRDQSAVSPRKMISSTGTKVSSSLRPRKLNPTPFHLADFRSFGSSSTPAAHASTSSLSKGKEDLRGVISSLEAFASQFISLEADNVRLQEEVKSSSSKLDDAIKKAAMARQEVDSLKEELGKLKGRLKEEETRAAERDELLRQSSLDLLEAANIPAAALDTVPNNSPANGVSMALASHQLTRELLERGKVFPVPSFVDDSSGALPEVDRIQRMKDRIVGDMPKRQ
ncbi:hypothetical protein QYE76_066031 [Lolium multiflorum]|uniref:Uncharacterized protein n=1 Tax=Lolium multiflorum TaxID=4521 RepID=A0AAD8W9C1_LOLMU|nr:hypothetical protein QYE76_066031 [Lolium multiflorum]